ncbi:MAG: DUF222 domain-containing protein [Acidimicrobiia bacterium]
MSFGAGRGDRDGFVDPVGDLRCAVDAVLDQDPASLSSSEKGVELIRLRRQIDRLEAVFAARVQDAHRNGVGLEDGHQSTPAWIAWQTGMPRPAVGKVLRHAELVELLPETGDAWRAGTITSTAVELIGRARVTGHDEELCAVEGEFLDRARRGDHKSLKVLTRHFAECARADGTKPAPPDGLSLTEVGTRWVLRGEFANPADAQTITDALHTFTRRPAADDPTTLTQRRAEGFVHLCEIALTRGTDTDTSRPVVSYLTHARAADDTMPPLTLGTSTGVISPGERDRILCDATRSTVTTDPDGQPLTVGRATNVWPVRIRRAIATRDRHCRWPGCEMPDPWCDAHHHHHWEHGGETDVTNGVLLCRRHHTFLHAHPTWRYTFDRQRFRVYRPDGTEIHPDPGTGHWAV